MIASACASRCLSRAFSRLACASSTAMGLTAASFGPRFSGFRASKAPASRWRRQSVRVDEYTPSRRRMAEMPPVSAARSVSPKIRSFSPAVNVRRFGRSDNSGETAAGAGTTVGLRPSSVPAPAAASVREFLLGMTT
jgi:hypothetical protein